MAINLGPMLQTVQRLQGELNKAEDRCSALEAENERSREAHLAIFSIAENAMYFVDQPSAITVLDEIRHKAGQFLTAESEADDA